MDDEHEVSMDEPTEHNADEGLVLYELRQNVKEFPAGHSVTQPDERKETAGRDAVDRAGAVCARSA